MAKAEADAERAVGLAGVAYRHSPTGALTLLRGDPKTQGPKLFRDNVPRATAMRRQENAKNVPATQVIVAEKPSASNLWGFGNVEWASGILDPKRSQPALFGATAFKEGEMVRFVKETIGGNSPS